MKLFWRWTFCCCTFSLFGAAGLALARDTTSQINDFPQIRAADLPKEGRDTLELIRSGGPYPYTKDGSIFSNREQRLPKQPRGFYHEFTVKTPRAHDRGARRIICGGKMAQQQAQLLETCYYTDDHYASFKKIKE